MARDLYEVLGVPRNASQEEIRRAYRRLAREHHPDVSGDPESEHRFKEINLAYQTLSDPARRRQYDMFGGEGFTPDMFGFGPDLMDIFESFFGGSPFRTARARTRTGPLPGADLRMVLDLTFEEAVFGARKEMPVRAAGRCPRCDGSGAEPGTFPSRCSRCGGGGEVSDVRRSVFGTVMTTRVCPTCGGSGEEVASPCSTCRGEGLVTTERTVTIDVPSGVEDGVDLRIEGSGEDGRRGGPAGDLYVGLRVAPHPVFERRGQDLLAALEIPLTRAALGAEVTIETLEGPETITVPPGTAPGTVLVLHGRGVPRLGRRGRGDLLVEVAVDVPRKLSREERGLLEQVARNRGEDEAITGRLRPPNRG